MATYQPVSEALRSRRGIKSARESIGPKALGSKPLGPKLPGLKPLGPKSLGRNSLGPKSLGPKPLSAPLELKSLGSKPETALASPASHRTLLEPKIHSLTLAVISSSDVPLVLLDGKFKVVAASDSFCRAFQIDPERAPGRSLFALSTGAWDLPQLRSLLAATLSEIAPPAASEVDFKDGGGGTRRLMLNAHKLDYPARILIILSVSDVTEVREKENLLNEKIILLKELQHRIGNSLQIIASVLLQSARRVHSDETRSHLYDAHMRIMSVATVQQQLAASRIGKVSLNAYLNDLCQSISDALIVDHARVSLDVSSDESVVDADNSISLGLIVTELVINALKHAFPGRRKGKIKVEYRSQGPEWTLSVADNGIGVPKDPSSTKTGLGTTIVGALATQLKARIVITDTQPGTAIAIVHGAIPAAQDAAASAASAC